MLSFTVSLNTAAGDVTLGPTATATVTILETDILVPTVTVAVAGDGELEEGGGKAKVFFSRNGDPSADLKVFYKVKGTAISGVDYKLLSGTLTIPAGASRAKIKIKPLENDVSDGTTKAKVKLLPPPDGSYIVGDPFLARVKIMDND